MADYQSEILEYLARFELASVEDLSRYLKVSPSTVRRHLAQLQDEGIDCSDLMVGLLYCVYSI